MATILPHYVRPKEVSYDLNNCLESPTCLLCVSRMLISISLASQVNASGYGQESTGSRSSTRFQANSRPHSTVGMDTYGTSVRQHWNAVHCQTFSPEQCSVSATLPMSTQTLKQM